jgi:hypothetical protein
MVQSKDRVVYISYSEATAAGELNTLAFVYRFVLDCYASKEAAQPGRPDDAEGLKNDRTATEIIPEPS